MTKLSQTPDYVILRPWPSRRFQPLDVVAEQGCVFARMKSGIIYTTSRQSLRSGSRGLSGLPAYCLDALAKLGALTSDQLERVESRRRQKRVEEAVSDFEYHVKGLERSCGKKLPASYLARARAAVIKQATAEDL